jgi:hypothetical protein
LIFSPASPLVDDGIWWLWRRWQHQLAKWLMHVVVSPPGPDSQV